MISRISCCRAMHNPEVMLVGGKWVGSSRVSKLFAIGERMEMGRYDSPLVASLLGFRIGFMQDTSQISGIARFKINNSQTLVW